MAMQGMNAVSGAVQAGAKAYAASDRRLKNVISRVGTFNHIGLYAYTYKPGFGLPVGVQLGVMADEVERVMPNAVGVIVDGDVLAGYKAVDYNAVFGGV